MIGVMAKSYSYPSSLSKLLVDLLPPISSTKLILPKKKINAAFPVRASTGGGGGGGGGASSPSSNKQLTPPHDLRKKLKKEPRARRRRRLITISTTDGKWQQGEWNCDFVFTLRELQVADLLADQVDDGHKDDAQVFVTLTIQKHAGFGFSVDGRVITSLNRKCSCCFSSYCREIDTTFDVWVLPSGKKSEPQLPEIGAADPSVIYVKPGSEADLDSLVRDAIRLTATTKDTCSESCEKSTTIWQYNDGKRGYDQRWARLLEIKKTL